MKGIILKALAGIGVLSLVVLGVRFALPDASHEEMARQTFGSPESIAALSMLYERVERDAAVLAPAGAKVRDIPQSWMPESVARRWSIFYEPDTKAVFAHLDDRGNLVAIEFIGSRFGVFVSRDPSRCPRDFVRLHRFSTSPIYVTGVVEEEG